MLEKLRLFSVYSLSNRVALPLAFVLLAWIVAVDWITPEISLNPFYLILVGLVTWNCGWKWGLFFSALSVASQLGNGLVLGHHFSEPRFFFIINFNKLFSNVVVVALLARLRILHNREKSSARIDFLTGALNYKGFFESLGVEMERHRRDGTSFSVAYIDCDNFKEINDRYGHKDGDMLLTLTVETMKKHLRRTDIVARLGGDEFAVVLPQTDRPITHKIISKIRHELADEIARRNWPVTFSIGVGLFPHVPDSEDEVISFADHLMYRVKASGKNNVVYDEFQAGKPVSDAQPGIARRVASPHLRN